MHRWCTSCQVAVEASEYARHRRQHRPGSTYAWRRIREQVLARDGGRCIICGETEDLEIHHVDGNWRNNRLDNLSTRCIAHHPRPQAA